MIAGFFPFGIAALVLKLTGALDEMIGALLNKAEGKSDSHRAARVTRTGGSGRVTRTGAAAGATPPFPGGNKGEQTSGGGRQAPNPPPPVPPRGKKPSGGKGLIIIGAVILAVFGIATITQAIDLLRYGFEWYWLEDVIVPALFALGGGATLGAGIFKTRRMRRYVQYLSLIGTRKMVAVDTLVQATGYSKRKVWKDLQKMLDQGYLPAGYLDLATGKLYLTNEGIADHPVEEEEKPAEKNGLNQEEAILREIRQVNDEIADPEMSRKIDRIGEITGKIFDYQRKNPNKGGQLHSFLSYYLPTTLKILRAYAQMEAQGIEGENISATKKRIEAMMDKVVEGFEAQLDRLFQDDAMDITADVAVLERMLENDGLGSQESPFAQMGGEEKRQSQGQTLGG